jgi:translation initiation factor 5B
VAKKPVEMTADDLADEEWGPVKDKKKPKKDKKKDKKKGKAQDEDEDEDGEAGKVAGMSIWHFTSYISIISLC